MGEGDGFGEVFVEYEGSGEGAADGRDFHGVREARAVVVTGAVEEDLGFVFEAAEGGGVDDAGDVALVFAAPAVGGLRVEASACGGGFLREGSEGLVLVTLDVFAGAEEGHVSRGVARWLGRRGGAWRGRRGRACGVRLRGCR